MVSTPASPSFSWTSSPPKKPASPPPKRRGWPNRSGRGLPPKARSKASRPRPTLTPKPPSRPVSRPKRPSRLRRIRRRPPSRSGSQAEKAARRQGSPRLRRRSGRRRPISPRSPRASPQTEVTKSRAGRTAPRRLPQRGGRRQLEHDFAAFADAVQPLRRDQIRHQGGLDRRARYHQAEDVAGLPAGLRARLQGRWRPLHQDHLRQGLFPQ